MMKKVIEGLLSYFYRVLVLLPITIGVHKNVKNVRKGINKVRTSKSGNRKSELRAGKGFERGAKSVKKIKFTPLSSKVRTRFEDLNRRNQNTLNDLLDDLDGILRTSRMSKISSIIEIATSIEKSVLPELRGLLDVDMINSDRFGLDTDQNSAGSLKTLKEELIAQIEACDAIDVTESIGIDTRKVRRRLVRWLLEILEFIDERDKPIPKFPK